MQKLALNKRLFIATFTGAVLGIFCIIGATVRSADQVSTSYLLAFWYNRVLMGLAIGLTPKISSKYIRLLRGAAMGLFVSFAFYSATGFADLIGFLAGIIYGIIIETVAYSLDKG